MLQVLISTSFSCGRSDLAQFWVKDFNILLDQ